MKYDRIDSCLNLDLLSLTLDLLSLTLDLSFLTLDMLSLALDLSCLALNLFMFDSGPVVFDSGVRTKSDYRFCCDWAQLIEIVPQLNAYGCWQKPVFTITFRRIPVTFQVLTETAASTQRWLLALTHSRAMLKPTQPRHSVLGRRVFTFVGIATWSCFFHHRPAASKLYGRKLGSVAPNASVGQHGEKYCALDFWF